MPGWGQKPCQHKAHRPRQGLVLKPARQHQWAVLSIYCEWEDRPNGGGDTQGF
ncbi:hypothetical protein MUN82_08630 [Hymenobacter aerilatus]|uniref:Uncharacterized protein n=1 Tax=Hymenobacter aerilatus TaxID=2932251 RepID=A0A8T9SYJ5_9BACT|nr:hypothetical protein [Hymenobacter aerilatus]UOR07148.1 hypothetical protein MUN82_08630 [Hymenobacter aerilatus]